MSIESNWDPSARASEWVACSWFWDLESGIWVLGSELMKMAYKVDGVNQSTSVGGKGLGGGAQAETETGTGRG